MSDMPFKIQREGDELVIRLGMNILEFATLNHPDIGNDVIVADKIMLLDNVVDALNIEDDDGLTQIERAIDNAILEVWDRGDASLQDKELDDGSED